MTHENARVIRPCLVHLMYTVVHGLSTAAWEITPRRTDIRLHITYFVSGYFLISAPEAYHEKCVTHEAGVTNEV